MYKLVLSDQYEDPIGDNDSLAEGSAEEVKDLVIFSVFPDEGEDEDAFSLNQGQLVFHKAGRYTIVSEYVSGYDGVNRMRITGISIEEGRSIDQEKKAAIEQLNNYKSADLYREPQKQALADAIANGVETIQKAETPEEVDKALAAAKAEIDKIKTAAQYQEEEELEQAKDEALAQLDKYKMEDYREAEQKELAASIETGRNAIDQAKDVKSVNRALTAARASIARLKTAAAYEAEEAAKQAEQEASLRQAKKEAEDQLDSYKKEEVYRTGQQSELDQARKAGKEAIEAAETEEQVREALSKAQKAMDQIKTDAQLSKEESAKAQEEAAKSAQEAEEKAKKEKEEAGPSLSSHEALVKKVRTENDLPGSGFLPLKARQKKARKNSITIQWDKVSGASGYIVYGTKCGQKKTFKRLADTGKCSYTQKKLKKGSYQNIW